MFYYEVAPTTIVRLDADVFTYASEEKLDTGQIVKISVGKKILIGIVIRRVKQPKYQTKKIDSLIEKTPLPTELVNTALWMSDYYKTPLAAVWQTILPRGLAKKRRQINRGESVPKRNRTKNVFTKDQSSAINKISNSNTTTALLHGVTGSGKTLVYIELAKRALKDDKSTIILVPEIALTSQLVAEFKNHFSDVVLTHSRQTEAKRHLTWQKVLSSRSPQIIIGPRSALFLPAKKLGLIVIDECHEPSFKQEQSPRYSALRTSSTLAKHHGAKAVFGSATPAIADYYLAKKSGAQIIEMNRPARAGTIEANLELVDMTRRDSFLNHPFISDRLIESLEKTFASGNQALIFHNRRGTASTTLCENCGWQAGCPRCFVPLSLHADSHQLRCHICNYQTKVPTSCPECSHADIIHKGIGTKRIETELKKLFPKQNIARFDGDSRNDSGIDKRYNELYSGEIDLIIGTQVVAKGLDLPKLRTVGIIQADAGLNLPDFGASERTFQLLTQAIGRVGRSHQPTTVIAQSYQPNHPAIQDGITRNYQDFYERTIRQRKHTNFPPFCYLLKLTCAYKTEKTAVKNAKQLVETLRRRGPKSLEILGPTPAFYERIRDTYRWQIIVKSPKRQDLVELINLVPKTNWQFELDPTSLI